MLMDIGRKYKIAYEKIADLLWHEIDNPAHYQTFLKDMQRRLLRQEEKFRSEAIKKMLAKALNVSKKEIGTLELIGGMTNKNYKVTIDKNDYIVRTPGNGTEKMINRKNERKNCIAVNGLGINAKIIHMSEGTGLKVAEFIEGAETLNKAMA